MGEPVAGSILEFTPNLADWLVATAPPGAETLLAHAIDGVIWGKVTAGRLVLARDAFPGEAGVDVVLRPETLQQARVFGPAGELHLWRLGQGFSFRVLVENAQPPTEVAFDDQQRLWGTVGHRGRVNAALGFSLLVEGRQGLRHAPPIVGLGADQRAALQVRHYVRYGPAGQAYVAGSRLLDLVPA